MNYDNARFMGNLDWAQQGRSHDALLFTKQDADRNSQLHLAFAFNQPYGFEPANLSGTDYLGINNYKSMIFVGKSIINMDYQTTLIGAIQTCHIY